ncbi:hypothetical protein [Imhoffiella purpurea]|uniref:Uncharacterized protein n=1 Tax=Imhoffiella purpurea TaxID=1249627 RepID=W9V8A2_9GAMM|nr:hypothetical protein [Imhoffiella purpurea]EXJ15659.1 hypothetical protein D779_1166 [Imhoffiella purpurea]
MSRPIDEMRVTLPQEVKQVYAGDLAAARWLGGREVRAGVPGEARAARVQEQRRIAEPPGLWKRFLNAVGIRRFTPEESYRARTHALSGKLRDVVTRLSTGHATKDALLGPMRDIASDIRTLALTVLANDPQMGSLIGQRRALLDRMQAGGPAAGTGAEESAAIERRVDAMLHDTERAIVGARLEALVTPMSDETLHRLRGVAEETLDRFRSQLPNRDKKSEEIGTLPEGPMKDQELALRDREYASYGQPIGLAMTLVDAADKALASRDAARQWETSGTGAIDVEGYRAAATPLLKGLESRLAPASEPRDQFQNTFRDTSRNMRFSVNGEPLAICQLGDHKADEPVARNAYVTDKERIAAKFGENAPKVLALLDQQLITQIANPLFKHATVEIGNPPGPCAMKSMNSAGRAGALQASMNVVGGENGVTFEVNIRRVVAEMEDQAGRTHRFDPDRSHLDVSYKIAITPDNHLIFDGEPTLAYHLKGSET